MERALRTLERSKEGFVGLIEETTVAYVQGFESLKAQVGALETPDLYKQAHDMWESLGTRSPWKKIKTDPRFEQAFSGLIQALLDDVVQRNDSLWASMIPLMNFDHVEMIEVDDFEKALAHWCNYINPKCADKIKCLLDNLEKHPHMQDVRNPRINSKLRDMAVFVPEKADMLDDRLFDYIEWDESA
jgi:hypothetical protein